MQAHEIAHDRATALRVAVARITGILERHGDRLPPLLLCRVSLACDEARATLEQYADTLDADETAPPVRQARGTGTQTASG